MAVGLSAALLCGLYGCGGAQTTVAEQSAAEAVKAPAAVPVQDVGPEKQVGEDLDAAEPEKQPSENLDVAESEMQSGEDLDATLSDTGNDDWYKEESVYTDDSGRRLEVFWDDEGMLGFAVDGLSLYFTSADSYQKENNWRIYTCDDGTSIIYYPGDPAHLEISGGEYAGMYEAGGDKVK